VRNVAVLVAIGVNQDGYRQILGIAEGEKEDKSGWKGFLRWLKKRGLKGCNLFLLRFYLPALFARREYIG
jgi:putative transposase